VATPAPAFTTQPSITPTSGTAGSTVYAATPGTVSNGTVVSRAWLLNGTAISTGVTAVPASAGTLTYQETASGPGGTTTSTVQVAAVTAATVTPTPAPSFISQPSISPNTGTAGATTFTATAGNVSNGSITSRSWTINGTVISTGITAAPASSGTLTYQETATGPGGTVQSTVQQVTVATAAAAAPAFTAQPTVSPSTGTAGTTTYTATPGAVSNGSITSRAWALNGSTISTGLTATPASAGTLTYQEFATGTGGTASSSIVTRTVSAAAPTLALSPNAPSIAWNAAAGTLVSAISNVPASVTPSVTPNDGRLVIAGSASSGWKVVVGMSALSTGQVDFSVAATGATSASGTLTVTSSSTGSTGVLRFASPRNRFPNTIGRPLTTQTSTWSTLIFVDHMVGSGAMSEIRARVDCAYIEQGTGKPIGNGFTLNQMYAEDVVNQIVVPITFPNRPYPITITDGEVDLVSDAILAAAFNRTQLDVGTVIRFKGTADFAAGSTGLPGHLVDNDMPTAGFCFNPALRQPTNLASPGAVVWGGSSPSAGFTMSGASQMLPMMLGKFVTGDPLVYLGTGDSIFMGSNDEAGGNGVGIGLFTRFLCTPTPATTGKAGCNTAVAGGAAGTWTSQGGGTGLNPFLATLVKYANRVVDNYGTNNFPTAANYSGSALGAVQGQVYSPWPYFRSMAVAGPGITPMKIWRTRLFPRTAGGMTTPFPEDQTVWFGGATVSEQWEAGGSVDQFHDWLAGQLETGGVDGIIDFDPIARADPFGNRATSVLYHRWAAGTFMVKDGTHPGPGYAILAAFMDDRIRALEGGTVVPKFSLIGSTRKVEGAAGSSTTYTFMVTRNTTVGQASVKWAVTGFSGATVKPTDFVAGVLPSGTATIASGAAFTTFNVVVKGDSDAESDELFDVTLSEPSNGYGLYFTTARGQITNDDGPPPLWNPIQLGSKLIDYFVAADAADTPATWTGRKNVMAYSQADASKRPVYSTTFNGRFDFDGVDDYFEMSKGTDQLPTGSAYCGIFAVNRNSTEQTYQALLGMGNGTAANRRRLAKVTGSYGQPSVDHGAGRPLTTTNQITWVNRTYAMIWEIAAGASPVVAFTAFDYNQKITTNNAVNTANVIPTAMRLGASEVIDSFWSGSVGSHGYLRESMTTDERLRLDGWMSWTSGYQGGNLPSDHPYKLVAPVIEAA